MFLFSLERKKYMATPSFVSVRGLYLRKWCPAKITKTHTRPKAKNIVDGIEGISDYSFVDLITKTQFQNTETALNSHLILDSAKKSSFWVVSGAFKPLTQKWPEHFCFWLPEQIFGCFLLFG